MIMLHYTLSVYSDFFVLSYYAMLHCTLSVYSDCCIRVFAIFLLAIGLHLFPKVRVRNQVGFSFIVVQYHLCLLGLV